MRVGVVGAGSMGRNHIRILSDLEGVELVAISDAFEEVVNKVSKKYNTKGYTDYKEMCDKENLDAVSIVVPTSLHKEVSLYFINKGVNVFLEKPIASTVEEADEIIKAVEENKIIFTVGHIERFNPAIQELKKRIENDELGKVYKIDVNRVGPFPARIRDVGVVIDLAVHDIDILRYITSSEIKRVYSETENNIHTSHEDLLSANVRLDNGSIANLNINWLTPTKIRKLYVTGEKGMFEADYISQDLYYYENEIPTVSEKSPDMVVEGKMIKYKVNKKEPLKLELEHFVECVRSGTQPLVTGEDAKKALFISKKLIESSKNNQVVLLK